MASTAPTNEFKKLVEEMASMLLSTRLLMHLTRTPLVANSAGLHRRERW